MAGESGRPLGRPLFPLGVSRKWGKTVVRPQTFHSANVELISLKRWTGRSRRGLFQNLRKMCLDTCLTGVRPSAR